MIVSRKKRFYIVCLLPLIVITLFTFFTAFTKKQVTEKPNIVFLLADDMRYNSLGCMGNTIVKTPFLDALASKATLFTKAHVTTPICAISRASILSGQYSTKHTIQDFETPFSDSARAYTYPNILKANGYYTGFIGKYGVGTINHSKPVIMPVSDFDYWKGVEGHGNYFYTINNKQIHSTDLMAQQAVEFLDTRDKTKPFCLSVSFKAPHVQDESKVHNGFLYSPAYENLYSYIKIPTPASYDTKYFLSFPATFRESPKGKLNEARVRFDMRFSTQEKFQESSKAYYRLVTGLDDAVKTIVQKLKQQNIENNTIIIFTSDNGYSMGDHGLEGKWYGHDVSLRVPLIIYDGRKQQHAAINHNLVLNIDMAPTILDYAGIVPPKAMQGQSLQPLVNKQKVNWRTSFYYDHLLATEGSATGNSKVYIPKSEGVVTEKFKYVRYFYGDNPNFFFYEELFQQSKDTLEINNVANHPNYALLKDKLSKELIQYRNNVKN